MKKQVLSVMIASLMATTVLAAEPTTVLEKTNALETTVYGSVQEGAIVDRVNQLDTTVYGTEFGSTTGNTLNKKVDSLYDSVEGTTTKVSLLEQLDALEYSYQNSVTSGSMVSRVEHLERSVNGRIGTGSLQNRIKSLNTKINGGSTKVVKQIGTLESTHVFKVTLNDALSTKTNKEGDTVAFTVAENIVDGNVLLVPSGTTGTATITKLKKARSFGRNGNIDMTFDNLKAIDGTAFTAIQGEEAKEKTKSELKAAGVSVAGAVLLGPVGLVGGAFIKGKSVEYPAGTEMYIQPQDTVTIQGLVIGGDGQAHSDDELADAVTSTPMSVTSDTIAESTVDTPATDMPEVDAINGEAITSADETVASADSATTTEVVDDSTEAENVSQPIVVVKRT